MNSVFCSHFRAFAIWMLATPAVLIAGVDPCQAQQRLKAAPKSAQAVTASPGAAVTRKHPLSLDLVAKSQPDGLIYLRGNIKFSPIVPGAKSEFGKYSLYRSTDKDWELIFEGNFMVDPYETVGITSRGVARSTRYKLSVVLNINGRDVAKDVEAAAP